MTRSPWRPWERFLRPKLVPYTGTLTPDEIRNIKASFSQGTPVPAFSPRHHYGSGGTIHQTGTIDIQVNWKTREVKAVWFRCLNLPFTVSEVDPADPFQHVINPEEIAVEEITYAELPREESSQ